MIGVITILHDSIFYSTSWKGSITIWKQKSQIYFIISKSLREQHFSISRDIKSYKPCAPNPLLNCPLPSQVSSTLCLLLGPSSISRLFFSSSPTPPALHISSLPHLTCPRSCFVFRPILSLPTRLLTRPFPPLGAVNGAWVGGNSSRSWNCCGLEDGCVEEESNKLRCLRRR